MYFSPSAKPKGVLTHALLYTDIDDIVSKFLTTGFGSMDVGDLIEKLLDMVKSHNIAIPSDITLLGRSMITMEGMLSACAPDVNMFQILSSHMASILMDDFDLAMSLRKIRAWLIPPCPNPWKSRLSSPIFSTSPKTDRQS